MTSRSGFLRLYTVLTFAWIAVIFYTVLPGRWEPWITWSAWETQIQRYPNTRMPEVIVPADIIDTSIQTRWTWVIGLSLAPPAVIYIVLFHIVPWVYRGFRATTS